MGNDPPICLGKFAFAVNRQDPDTANIPAQIFGLGLDGVYAAGGLCLYFPQRRGTGVENKFFSAKGRKDL